MEYFYNYHKSCQVDWNLLLYVFARFHFFSLHFRDDQVLVAAKQELLRVTVVQLSREL